MKDAALERRYVGAVMMAPAVADRVRVPLDAFADVEVRHVVECVYSLSDRGESVTEGGLDAELSRRGYHRERQASPMTWARVTDDVASVARRLVEMHTARQIHEKAAHLVRVCESTGDPAQAREVMRELYDLGRGGDSSSRVKTFRDVVIATAEELAKPPDDRGLRLGWNCIDDHYHLAPGQLFVLGAQTNVGKTSAFATWALNMAERGEPVAVISVEDGADDWGAKWIGEIAHLNPSDMWMGRVKDMSRAIVQVTRKAGLPIFFSEVVDRSIDAVLADMAHVVTRHGVKAVFVDYLQAITLPAGYDVRTGTDRVLALLIAQAGRLGVALVLACQLSRPPKDKAFREPGKHDLKESGTIENRAQCITMLWKDPEGQIWIKVEKAKRTAFRNDPIALIRNPTTGALCVASREGYADAG